MLELVYLVMGIIVGILIKHESEIRARKKRLHKRILYSNTIANDDTIKQYDEILSSIKSLNDSLRKKKEV